MNTIRVCRRQKTLQVFICAVAVGYPGCVRSNTVNNDQYGVYAAVINEIVKAEGFGGDPAFYDEQRPIRVIVIAADLAAGPPIGSYVSERLPGLDSSTIVDLETRAREARLTRKFAGIGEYELIPADELTTLIRDGGWKGFYDRFPFAPGFMEFSQVGFDSSRSQAIVHAMHLRDGLWGHTDFYLLERSDGEWRVVGSVRMATSDRPRHLLSEVRTPLSFTLVTDTDAHRLDRHMRVRQASGVHIC